MIASSSSANQITCKVSAVLFYELEPQHDSKYRFSKKLPISASSTQETPSKFSAVLFHQLVQNISCFFRPRSYTYFL